MATSDTDRRRIVVIGAGAAGTMAAIFAAASGADTLLLERTADGGRKILISGGGRCNILPARLDESRFVSDSPPHLVRRIVRSWPLREQVAFFERELGLPLVEEIESAKLFPASQRARDVRDRLLQLAQRRGAQLLVNTTAKDVRPVDVGWRVELRDGEMLHAGAVIIATGGLSVPSTGSDGTGLRVAQTLGHDMIGNLSSPHAADGPSGAVCQPLRHLAAGDAHCSHGGALGNGHRRIPLHASRLQRAQCS